MAEGTVFRGFCQESQWPCHASNIHRVRRTHLGFTNGDSDKLGTHVGKESEDEGIDETEESTKTNVVHDLVWLESSTILPVPETDSLLAWYTSEVDDETEEDKTSEGDDLDE